MRSPSCVARGIDSGILIAPLMPGINDTPEQVGRSSTVLSEAGATFLGGVALHLRGEVKDVFFGWLRAKRPDLVAQYERLYGKRAYMRPEDRDETTKHVRGWGSSRSDFASGRQATAPALPSQRRQPPRRTCPLNPPSSEELRRSSVPFVQLLESQSRGSLSSRNRWNLAPCRIRPPAAWS